MIEITDYELTHEFFSALVTEDKCPSLVKHLEIKPELLDLQDENGRTLFHHAVNDYRFAAIILKPFMNLERLSVRDNKGQTPVHVAAVSNDSVRDPILSLYLNSARNNGYDFSLMDNKYDTPLSLLIVNPRRNPMTRELINQIPWYLSIAGDVNINQINVITGMTPLALALALDHLEEANTLLDHGADPLLYAEPQDEVLKSLDIIVIPATLVARKIQAARQELADLCANFDNAGIQQSLHPMHPSTFFRVLSSGFGEVEEAQLRIKYLKTDYIPLLENISTKIESIVKEPVSSGTEFSSGPC
ncbi:ankyrin repeat domain-containing protein [Legionella worsleiensis]|uniref:Ankyrin repeat protein n=1 Tax=Legionella worsleiensis TaxID=45076 RepID=A0A0W1AJJ4_9GAMM|nr:ankyrin repeat domain-containing protein [Legionella worsleiensis]KTD81406.1 Ankyrin repeat protein [Legionella worsleiensis]STY30072.1 Ankyrin repeat [Legionella worsleiensis]